MVKKNMASLAKGKVQPNAQPKKTVKTIVEPKKEIISVEDERNAKVKKKVEELLIEVDLTTNQNKNVNKDDEIIEIVDEQGVDWLREQITLLSEANEDLREKLANKNDGVDKSIKMNVIGLFNEIQDNYIKMGKNMYGQPNLILNPNQFIDRMMVFFPFLKEIRRV